MLSDDQAIRRHRTLMQALARRHQAILELIGGEPVEYVDIPVHGNVGDLLIYLGTLAFLRGHGVPILGSTAYFNYRDRRSRAPILLHGGGNFGDLYPRHQRLRERIVARHPERRIIVLPQTIHFASPARFSASAAIMAKHPDLHIFVRDKRSLELARAMTPHAHLVPDMAHQLYPLAATGPAHGRGTLQLLRTDRESRGGNAADAAAPGAVRIDWPQLAGRRHASKTAWATRAMRALAAVHAQGTLADPFARWWEAEARRLVDKAVALFAGRDAIVSDRLHAHILACLMDLPSTVRDNSYGKNAGYVRRWTGESPLVTLEADTRPEDTPS